VSARDDREVDDTPRGDGAAPGGDAGGDAHGSANEDAPFRPRIARPRRPGSGRAAVEGDMRIAAIDVGSNSIRQIVADVSPEGKIHVIDEMKAMPRLGAGVDERGALSEESVRAAIAALSRMATLARQMAADRIEAVADERGTRRDERRRVRRARARGDRARVRVLTGAEEARLAYRARSPTSSSGWAARS
jgi:hypothetical protein